MISNTSLDNTCEQDYSEFLSEYLLQTNEACTDLVTHYDDGEMEAEWLVSAGYPELTQPFAQGIEIRPADLEPVLAALSSSHAEAIKQRVRALNHTVRGRAKNRSKRKPDIRDVFREFDESSTGTRSRSATPDSLDSVHGDDSWVTTTPSFVATFDHNTVNYNVNDYPSVNKAVKQRIRRTPSAPLKSSTSTDIFRGSQVRCDIPMYFAEGIELLGFSRIGTIHMPRNRSGSDPSCSIGRVRGKIIQDSQSENNGSSGESSDELPANIARKSTMLSSPEKILNKMNLDSSQQKVRYSSTSQKGISFESMCQENANQDSIDTVDSCVLSHECNSDINTMNETELKRLQPIFWLELAAIFDRNHVSLDKRKPFKRRRKEEGSLFGVSLNALIRRDQQLTGMDSTLVPQFLEGLLEELKNRGTREEGILRVAGQKHKTDLIYSELESSYYQKPDKCANLLSTASVHELSALLKRWLRELPQPLLTSELIQLFYQCHSLPQIDQMRALSILCQMLPHENRNTLRSILHFLNLIVDLKDINKMNLYNVSTIIAPSFFPPRYIYPIDKNSIEDQVKMAALCCRVTNVLITGNENLFLVSHNLISDSRNRKTHQGKRKHHRSIKTSNIAGTPDSSGNTNTNSNVSGNHDEPSIIHRPSINPCHVHRFVL